MAEEGNRSNVPKSVIPQSLCIQFQRWGSCASGERCRFSHTTSGSIYGPSQSIAVMQGNPAKVVACRHFSTATGCPYGNECQFLHVEGKAEYRESAAITIATTAGHEGRKKTHSEPERPVGSRSDMMEPKRPVRTHSEMPEPKRSVDSRNKLKTRLCTKWERTGTCYYGSSCKFAHGNEELQSVGSSNPLQLGISAGISAPANSLAPNEIGSSAPSKKKVFDWDDVHKISRIYGDWIESPPCSP
ncbi:unnamed protein product [Withania somnifera]